MPLYHASGNENADLTTDDLRSALQSTFQQLGPRGRVIAVPPDLTRVHSQAGPITCLVHELLGERLTDVLPALGTHMPMTDAELASMFPTVPKDLFRVHRWRDDVVTLGEVPAEFVQTQPRASAARRGRPRRTS